VIEYIDVHKAFDVPVLSGVDLTIETRETLSIVGPSGTGKSVLLKTTNGLLQPDRGDVRIDGASVYHSERDQIAEMRRKVGYVFQYAALFDSMNVFENVCTGLPRDEEKRARSPEVLRKVCEALEDVNLDPAVVLKKLPSELSGGMRKRASLARALALDPDVLFLDEPTAGLDPIGAAHYDELVKGLNKSLGVTILMVTHDLDSLYAACDRIAVLLDKRVVVGTIDELLEFDHPWVQEYFRGPRGRAAAPAARQE
jgi:phospholipid/cholesterol/gamma-HCH transport system ATP-binding protein